VEETWSVVLLDDAHYGSNYPELDCAMQEKFCALPQDLLIDRARSLQAKPRAFLKINSLGRLRRPIGALMGDVECRL
jgi:hypothetical protein